MGKDRINEKIKDKVIEHSVYLDKDDLWANIEGQQKKKRRFPLFWIVVGVSMVLLIVGYNNFRSDNNIDSAPVKEIQVNMANQPTQNGAKELSNKSDDETIENDEIEKTSVNDQSINPVNESTEKSNKYAFLRSKKQGQQVDNNNNNILSSNHHDKITVQTPQHDRTSNISSKAILYTAKTKQNIDTQLNESSETKNIITSPQNIKIASLLALNTKVIADQRELDINLQFAPTIARETTKKSSKFSFWAQTGMGNYSRTFENTKASSNDVYDIRSQNENTLYSIHFGLGTKYQLTSSLYLKSGLDYTRFTEKYTDIRSTSQDINSEQIIQIHEDYSGTITTSTGIVDGIETLIITSKYFNHITTYNIPFLVGYSRKFTKWSIFGELGAVLNVLSKYDGHQATDQQSFEYNPTGIYKSSIGISYQGSIGLSYRLTDKWEIYTTANQRFALQSINKESYGINQKLKTIGIHLGVERKF